MKIRVQIPSNSPFTRLVPAAGSETRVESYPQAYHPKGRGPASEPEAGVIVELWRFFRRNPVKIVVAAALGILLGVILTLPQHRIYQAAATLEIQELNENFMNFKEAYPVSDGTPSLAPTDIQTQLRILTSATLVSRVLDKLPPEPEPPDNGVQLFLRRFTTAPQPRTPDRDALVERARENLQVKEARQARIVDLMYDSPDPRYAADFVNALSQEYIEQNVEARWKMSQRTAEWLSRQLGEMRKKLADSEDRLQNYSRRSGLLFTSDKQNPSEAKLRQVQESLTKAQEDRMMKQARMEATAGAAPEAMPEMVESASLRDNQSKLTDLRRQRAELSTVFKPSFDLVKRLDAQIATLETALNLERAAVVQRMRNEYEGALRREKLLQESYGAQSELVARDGEKAVQYGMLQREADSNRQLYELMLRRVNETSVASAMRASNVRVVDPGKPPRAPYKPSLTLNMMWGLTAGLLCGMVIAAVSERSDRRIRRPGDLNFYLSVPELGAVPSANGSLGAKVGYVRGSLPNVAGDFNVEVLPAGKPVEACVELVAWQQRSSMLAESFRSILTSVLFSGGEGEAPRVIVVTSALPSEGKTTVVSNMAAALARIGRRVLVIDADLRRPRLHQVFDVSQDYGLFDLLTSGARDFHDLLPYVVRETFIPGAFLLVGGPHAPNTTDLLYSSTMADLLRQARQSFDMVVIDTPPMLDLPDARALGRMSDGVVLVVRAGATTRDVALSVKQRLQEDGIPLLGTVLNNWTPSF